MLGALCPLLVIVLAGCSSTPDPTGITTAQRKAATQADLDLRWAQVQLLNPNYSRPAIAVIKYSDYLDEGPLLTTCMHRAGYEKAQWGFTTGLTDTGVKLAARFALDLAIYTCEAKYPADPLELGYLSDAQEEYLYYYWSNETVPCLRSHGAKVANLAPVGQFGEGYEDVGALNPFQHADMPYGVPVSYLTAVCPPYPGQLYAKHK